MLVIVAKNTLKPGTAAAFQKAAEPLIAASRGESGNIAYDLFADTKNPDVLTFIEKWQDEAAIAAHNRSPHFTETLPKLAEFAAGAMDVTIYRQVL
jgi:quinol monooxygenase YgiN